MAGSTRSKSSSKCNQELEGENVLFNSDQIKELLKMQESTIKSFFAVIVETTNTRLDNIVKEMQSIKASLEYTQAEIADLQKMNCQDRLDSLEANINTLIDKADDLENRSRRNNLCFEGIDEQMHGNETWEESENKVKDLISNTLQIDAVPRQFSQPSSMREST